MGRVSMVDQSFSSRSAFTGSSFAAAGPDRLAGITDRDGLGVATVLLRKGRILALEQRVRQCFGIALPRGARRETSGGIAFAGTGPEAWLATGDLLGYGFAPSLREVIGDLASISEQSDALAILRLTGYELCYALAKIVAVDLHPRAFKPGDVASTVVSQIGATLWRLEDATAGAPVFEIAVPRSLAQTFSHALLSQT
jgi:methylglutamate dehydrogenase subunit D